MWKLTNYKGEPVTWYSEEDMQKYKQALEEIREDLETQVYCECSECGNDDYSTCIECMTKRYIEKINEVLNDN